MIQIQKLTTIGLISLLPAISANSQANDDPNAADAAEIFELSPFVVRPTEGYQARETLAGTRLRSDLGDVAAPISVFTRDLLEDLGASDVQQAMVYSVSVESEDEFAPDDSEGMSIGVQTQTRVRGLTAATQSRGFFRTNMRSDGYNTETYTVARGPNSVLFGLGSPAGVIDSTPLRAMLGSWYNWFSTMVDSNSGYRIMGDVSVPAIDDRLAVRIAAVTMDRKSFLKPDFDQEDRFYVTAAARPFSSTTINVSYENMDTFRVRSRRSLTNDGISEWLAAGQPIFHNGSLMDPNRGRWSWDGGQTWRTPDPNNADEAYLVRDAIFETRQLVYIAGGTDTTEGIQKRAWPGATSHSQPNDWPTFKDGSIIPVDLNVRGLASHTHLEGSIANITLEQKLTNNLFFEGAYNRETWTRDSNDPVHAGASLEADVNAFIPGTDQPNPNVGRYFLQTPFMGWYMDRTYESYRGMISYELDLRDVHSLLGWHTFGLLYQKDEFDELQYRKYLRNAGDDIIDVMPPRNLTDTVRVRYYLNVPALGEDVPHARPYAGPFVMPDPDFWQTTMDPIMDPAMPSHTLQELEGRMFVWQGRFFGSRLITTMGLRKDTETVYQVPVTDRDPVTSKWLYSGIPFADQPRSRESGITRTYGAVYRTPLKGVTLLYNRSTTFEPQGDLLNWYDEPFGPSTGKGEDYGIDVRTADERIGFRLTRFENSADNSPEFDWFYEITKWRLINEMENLQIKYYQEEIFVHPDLEGFDQSTIGTSPDDQRFVDVHDFKRVDRSFRSSGYELELFSKPVAGLDIRLTATRVKTVNTDINMNLRDYIADRWEIWEKYFGLPDAHGSEGARWDANRNRSFDDGVGGTYSTRNPTDNFLTARNSVGYKLFNDETRFPRLLAQVANEGTSASRHPKWRLNLVGSYSFQEGWLRGSRVGGAVRYRSKPAVGYQTVLEGDRSIYERVEDLLFESGTVSDIQTIPIWGKEQFNVDLWVSHGRNLRIGGRNIWWSVQLNVRNVFEGSPRVVPHIADSDGTVRVWAPREPRVFQLFNRFRF